MWIIVKILVTVVLTIALLVIGFALGYPIGKHEGFESGSEWALIQAKLAARDAGVIMPVYMEDGQFHVVLRPSADGQRKSKKQETACADAKVVAGVSLAHADGSMMTVSDVPPAAKTIEAHTAGGAQEQAPDIWY